MSLSSLKICDASGWTMFIFGVLAFLFGVVGLVSPETLLSLLGFEIVERAQRVAGDYTLTFIAAASMASFNMGSVLRTGGPERYEKVLSLDSAISYGVTFTVFTILVVIGFAPTRFWGVGVWELTGAVATAWRSTLSAERRYRR